MIQSIENIEIIINGKNKEGNNIQMFKTIRWGGLVTYILKNNGKEFEQYPPNIKEGFALELFKRDYIIK